MKFLYFSCILLSMLAFNSCKKNAQTSLPQANGKVLPGVWELRNLTGGMVVYNMNNYKPGNGNLWKFTQTDFSKIDNDSTFRSGIYSINVGGGVDLNTGRKIDQFVFNSEAAESFELRNDTLIFYYAAISYDGVIEKYVKIADDSTATNQ